MWSNINEHIQKFLFGLNDLGSLRGYRFQNDRKLRIIFKVFGVWNLFLNILPLPKHPNVRKDRRKNILLIKMDHLGDLVISSAVFPWLRDSFPDTYIAVVVGSWGKEIVERIPELDEVFVFDFRFLAWENASAVPGKWHQLWKLLYLSYQLHKRNIGIAIDLSNNSKWMTMLMAYISGAEIRVGDDYPGRGAIFTHIVPYNDREYILQRHFAKLKTIGVSRCDHKPIIYPSQEDREKIESYLQSNGISDQDILIGIHPGAGCSSKLWKEERFAQVADKLIRENQVKVLFTGSIMDQALIENILNIMGEKVINSCGKLSVHELAVLYEYCLFVITVDSGPMHIAAAVGTPVIALFSGTNFASEWHPWGNGHQVIQKKVDCQPCHLSECKFEDHCCMDLISTEEVLFVAQKFLEKLKIQKTYEYFTDNL